jgi:Domain of unknown function (DUF4160)
MPTVLRVGGLRFVIWLNDHPPPHVHVFSADAEATIALGASGGKPHLIENRRMKPTDLAAALHAAFEHQTMLRQKWSEIHGGLGK